MLARTRVKLILLLIMLIIAELFMSIDPLGNYGVSTPESDEPAEPELSYGEVIYDAGAVSSERSDEPLCTDTDCCDTDDSDFLFLIQDFSCCG